MDKAELWETVQRVETEATKDEQANPNRVERLFTTLRLMALGILDVTLAAIRGPKAGVATAVQKIAQKAGQAAG